MTIITHQIGETTIAEASSKDIIINTTEEGLDLLGNFYYQGFDKIIIHKEHLTREFFNHKNGIAGEILQKFSNYRVRLAIVGDFSKITSKSLNAFIIESNKGRHVNFLSSTEEAIRILSDN